ncbi:MAG TPA: hypothetical protein VHS31_15815 [Tepidisphaeraceae bacterium]|jgi:hypothetical protein|nr:hypothetical protein [Tepidisphaeraceae bacterium]
MDSSKLQVKFYLNDNAKVKLADVAPVFHSWIQTHAMAEHMLIDVADYTHVPDGPGMLLVSDEANIYLDQFDGRLGLTYSRKRPIEGTLAERLKTVIRYATQACALLEASPILDGAKFKTNEATFKINDRLAATNTAATFAKVRPELEKAAQTIFGAGVTLEHKGNEKQLFEVGIKSANAPTLAALAR